MLQLWIEQINKFGKDQLREFEQKPTWDNERKRGGETVLDYVVPDGAKGETVVCANWLENGNCKDVDRDVESWLQKSSIRAVFTGHQPHGTCPSVIHSPNGLQVFMCDTSYSGMATMAKSSQPTNTRGISYSNVVIGKDTVMVGGILADGSSHGFSLSRASVISPQNRVGDQLLGTKLKDDYWVKTRLENGTFLAAKGEGRNINLKTLSESVVKSQVV